MANVSYDSSIKMKENEVYFWGKINKKYLQLMKKKKIK